MSDRPPSDHKIQNDLGVFSLLDWAIRLKGVLSENSPAVFHVSPNDFSEKYQEACALVLKTQLSPFMAKQIQAFLDHDLEKLESGPHFSWIKNLRVSFASSTALAVSRPKLELTPHSASTLLQRLNKAHTLVTNRTFHKDIPFTDWDDLDNPKEILARCLDFLTPQEVTLLKTIMTKVAVYQKQTFIGRLLSSDRGLVKAWKSTEDTLFFRSLRKQGFGADKIAEFQFKDSTPKSIENKT